MEELVKSSVRTACRNRIHVPDGSVGNNDQHWGYNKISSFQEKICRFLIEDRDVDTPVDIQNDSKWREVCSQWFSRFWEGFEGYSRRQWRKSNKYLQSALFLTCRIWISQVNFSSGWRRNLGSQGWEERAMWKHNIHVNYSSTVDIRWWIQMKLTRTLFFFENKYRLETIVSLELILIVICNVLEDLVLPPVLQEFLQLFQYFKFALLRI